MKVTVDGYVAGPNGELDWLFRTMDPRNDEWMIEYLRGVDTVLLGRTTYLEQAAAWPSRTGEMADLLNAHQKVVFSSKLDSLEWNNSRFATADAAEEIAWLKQQDGLGIYVSGGAELAQSLSRAGLVDEYNIAVHPVVLGCGVQLFAGARFDLERVATQAFDSGVVQSVYRPSGQPQLG